MVVSSSSSSSLPLGGSDDHNHYNNSRQRRQRYCWIFERGILIAIVNVVLIGLLYNHRAVTKQTESQESQYSFAITEQKETGFKISDNEKNNERLLLQRESSSNKNKQKNKQKEKKKNKDDDQQRQQQQQQQQELELRRQQELKKKEQEQKEAQQKEEEQQYQQQQQQQQQEFELRRQHELIQEQQQELKKKEQEQKQKQKEEETTTDTDIDINNDDERLNIILFYADDWTMNVLGKLNKDVHTPNIDKMADEGIMFINNCVTTSVCWISRATLMTGLYYSKHLQSKPHVNNIFTSVNWNHTLFPLLKAQDYYTGIVGKWHAPNIVEYMSAAFNEYSKLYFGEHWSDYFSGDGTLEHVTELNKRHSIEFLRNRPKDKNFALKVSFFATHAWDGAEISYQPMNAIRQKYYPDNATMDAYNNYKNIKPPKTAADDKYWKELPWFFNEQTAGRARWRNRFEPHIWQKNIKDLYSMATEVDFAIGEIIQELKNQGVYNNTMLLFTTDNGDLHGEHGLVEKWYPFEESIKVPLIIVDPRMLSDSSSRSKKKKIGTINKEFTLNIDLAPTILGAANIKSPNFMQGRDISDLYLDDDLDNDEDEEEENDELTTQQQQQQQHVYNNSTMTSRVRRRRQLTGDDVDVDVDVDANKTLSSSSSSLSLSSLKKKRKRKLHKRVINKQPWRTDWYYEWNMGHPHNASGHEQEHFIDAAFALITKEWKYIYWPQKQYEQLYHRSIDIYDEYDIIQNYYILNQGPEYHREHNIFQPQEEYMKIDTGNGNGNDNSNFSITKTNPIGDSIQSTKEIYNELKTRFNELKQHVQNGYKV
jgi:arylsulfatase